MYNGIKKRDLDLATPYFVNMNMNTKAIGDAVNLIANIVKRFSSLIPLTNLKVDWGGCMMFKKAPFKKIGGYRDDMRWMEDTAIVRDIHKNGYRYSVVKAHIFADLSGDLNWNTGVIIKRSILGPLVGSVSIAIPENKYTKPIKDKVYKFGKKKFYGLPS
jgi:hypothetical protein